MSLILTDYDLSGGVQDSSEVATPGNWRVTATTTGAPARQRVRVDFYVEDEDGNWAVLRDDADLAIHLTLIGNETKSINPVLVNGANGLCTVRPPKSGGVGTINIDSINS